MHDGTTGIRFVIKTIDSVEQFHCGSNRSIERIASANVVADFGYRLMRFTTQIFLRVSKQIQFQFDNRAAVSMLPNGVPESLEKTKASLHTGVGPFKRLLGWSCKHHEQANGVGAEFID